MFKKLRKMLARIRGISTPFGGISWSRDESKAPAYESLNEFLVIATVASVGNVSESFKVRVSVPETAGIEEIVNRVKFQRVISRSLAQGEEPPQQIALDEVSDPVLFDWALAPIPSSILAKDVAHGRVIIAIFDPELPAAKAAALTKDAVRDDPAVREYLFPSAS